MRLFIKFVIGLVLAVGSFYIVYDMTSDGEKQKLPYEIVSEASIEEYYVYGTSFNLKGTALIEEDNVDLSLLLYHTSNNSEKRIPLSSHKNGEVTEFYLSEKINDGFSLEELEIGNYYVLLELKMNEEESRYYRLENTTSYDNATYYTLSKTNHKIIFTEENDYHTFYLKVSKNKNSDVYDIVIDAGHGGKDSGAYVNGHSEKDINLHIALLLADKLKENGVKVFLTREKDIYLNNYSKNGNDSRISLIHKSHAKYLLSLHLNSSASKKASGVEVYTNPNIQYDFASSLADHIVNVTSSDYSLNMTSKMYNGVYTRLLTQKNIESSNQEAIEKGIEPYNIKENTVYYFIIRESGGIVTNAYVDGRDEDVGINPYYNSNIGIEAYLVEMGYLTNSEDYNNLTNHADRYVEALYQAIMQELGYE